MRKTPTATKARSRPAPKFPDLEPLTDLLRTIPLTTEERLLHIKALGKRINGYITFMCSVHRFGGASAESREKSIAYFYERLAFLEKELALIHENLQLG